MKNISLVLVYSCLVILVSNAYSNPVFADKRFGNQTAILVVDDTGKNVYKWQAEKQLMPASVLKIITAQIALEQWGADYQFKTDFYLENNVLWVKGYGDPFLVSEELEQVAITLAAKLGDTDLQGVAIDATFFKDAKLDARTNVNDPYNAPLSAVAANFNTVYVAKNGTKISSAEPQTPITPTAIDLAKKLNKGKHRINVGDARIGQQYFAELLGAKLRARGVTVGSKVIVGDQLSKKAELFYQHINSNPLSHLLRGTLEYSNNFIANQIFMMLGTQNRNRRAELSLAKIAVTKHLNDRYGGLPHWQDFSIEEGAGLSRENRFSAKQLLDILRDFQSNKSLLKSYENGLVLGKTGTLKGVRTFAGYIENPQSDMSYYFIFLFNEPIPYRYREKLLKELLVSLGVV